MATTVKDILLQFSGSSDDADRALDNVIARLEKLDGDDAEATVRLAHERFDAEVAKANAELDALASRDVSARVKLKIDKDRGELNRVAQDASAAFERFFTPRIAHGRQVGILGDVGRLTRDLAPALGALREAQSGVEELATSADRGAGVLATFGDKVSQISPVIGGIALVIVASLVPAMLAIGSSAVAAIAGIGALATAFTATLAPAVLLGVGLFSRISKVMEVVKGRDQQRRDAAIETGKADDSARSAAEARHAASIALRDAIQSQESAERSYADAVEQARKRIAAAQRDESDAERGLSDARKNAAQADRDAHRKTLDSLKDIKSAVKDAYKAWVDAVSDAKDAELDLEYAQLGILDANEKLVESQDAFNKLLNQLPSDRIGDVLKKLQDVNLPEADAIAFIKQAGGKDERDARNLYKAYLDLQRAKLDVKRATLDETKAQRDLNTANGSVLNFLHHGLDAYGPYRDAVKAAADAQRDEKRTRDQGNRAIRDAKRDLDDARKSLRELERDGVKGASNVRNAQDTVRDAAERVAEAQRNVRRAGRDAATGLNAASTASQRLDSEWKNLSGNEKRLVRAIERIKSALRSSLGGDTIIGLIATGLNGAARILRQLAPEFKRFTGIIADSLRDAFRGVGGASSLSTLKSLVRLSSIIAAIAIPAFRDFFKILKNIGEAAMPALLEVALRLGNSLHRAASSTSDIGRMREVIGTLVDSMLAWLRMIGRVVVALGRIVEVVAPFGNQLVDMFGKAAENLGKWAQSAGGRKEIQSFFKDTLPFVKAVATLLFNIVTLFLRLFQFVAPALTPIVQGFADMVGVLSKIVGFLNSIVPAPIRELLGLFLGIFRIGPRLISLFGRIPGLIGTIARLVTRLSFVSAIVHALGDVGGAIANAASAVGHKIIDLITGPVSSGAGDIVGAISDGIQAAPDALKDAAVWVAEKYVDLLKAEVNIIKDVGGWLVDRFVDGVKAAATAIASAAAWLVNAYLDAVKAEASAITAIGGFIVGAIGDGIRAATGTIGSAIGTVWDTIKAIPGDVLGVGGTIIGTLVNALSGGAGGVAKVAAAVWGAITNGVSGVTKTLGNIVGSIGGGIAGVVKRFRSIGSSITHAFSAGLGDIKGLGGRAVSAGRGIVSALLRGIGNVGSRVARAARGAVGAFARGVGNAGSSVVNRGRSIVRAFIRGIGSLAGTLRGYGTNVVGHIADGINRGIEHIVSAAKRLASKLVDAVKHFLHIGSPSKIFAEIGGHVVDGFVNGLHAKDLVKLARDLFGGFGGAAKKIIGGIVSDIGGVVGKIASAAPRVALSIDTAGISGPTITAPPGPPPPGGPGMPPPGPPPAAGIVQNFDQTFEVNTHAAEGTPDPEEVAAKLAYKARTQGGFSGVGQ